MVLDESQAAALDEQSGTLKSHDTTPGGDMAKTSAGTGYNEGWAYTKRPPGRGDQGGASRFFKVAASDGNATEPRTSVAEALAAWESHGPTSLTTARMADALYGAADDPLSQLDARFLYAAKAPKRERPNVDGVAHPTVKPLTLMRWLVRLVTPPGGTVLEPFAGSGTTVEACLLEGFRCVAIERGDEYLPLILERVRRQREAAMVQELARVTDPEAAILDQLDLPFEVGEATA